MKDLPIAWYHNPLGPDFIKAIFKIANLEVATQKRAIFITVFLEDTYGPKIFDGAADHIELTSDGLIMVSGKGFLLRLGPSHLVAYEPNLCCEFTFVLPYASL